MDDNKERIFVDEAGNPGLPNPKVSKYRPYFIFGYVYSRDPEKLRIKLKRLLKRLHQQNKYPDELHELKFYLPHTDLLTKHRYTVEDLRTKYHIHLHEVRSRALSIINEYSDGIFAAVVDKRKAVSRSWASEPLQNFVFSQTLFANILNFIQAPRPPEIIYDEGRLSPTRTDHFYKYTKRREHKFQQEKLKEYHGTISILTDTSSVSEPGIWAADMVAGSFYHKYANSKAEYSDMIRSKKIGYGERLFWK